MLEMSIQGNNGERVDDSPEEGDPLHTWPSLSMGMSMIC